MCQGPEKRDKRQQSLAKGKKTLWEHVAKPRGLGSSAERQGSENRTQEQLGILVLRAHPQDFKSVPCHGIRKRQKDSKEVM